MELVKVTTPEYLSHDIFDEDFLKTFLMLHRLQYVMGSSRLDVRNRFVTPPTAAQKCYTILCILMTAVSNIALSKYFIFRVKHAIIRYLGLSSIIIQFSSFVSNTIHVRFFNSDKNVEFYVKMQKIDRLLKVDRWTVLNNRVRRVTNISVACTLLTFLGLMIITIIEEGFICLYFIGPAYSILVILIELIACSSIICYFVLRIRFINSLMENHLTPKIYPKTSPKAKRVMSLACIKSYTHKTRNYYETSDTNLYLRELLKCFTMYQDLYRFQLFIFCLQSVVASLITFEQLLHAIQNSESTLIEMATCVMFTVLDILAAVFLGFRYDIFFGEVKATKRLCINVMAKHHEGPLREKARKMLKMIEETPPRFSVYEMWEMNAGTFVTMLSLITSGIVTLLQFAFL